jgi:hypothetical protein
MAIIKGLSRVYQIREDFQTQLRCRPDGMQIQFLSDHREQKHACAPSCGLKLTRTLSDKAGSGGIITLKSNQYPNRVEKAQTPPIYC